MIAVCVLFVIFIIWVGFGDIRACAVRAAHVRIIKLLTRRESVAWTQDSFCACANLWPAQLHALRRVVIFKLTSVYAGKLQSSMLCVCVWLVGQLVFCS